MTFLILLNLSACDNVPLSVEVEAADYIAVAEVSVAPDNTEIDVNSEETKLDEIEYKTIEPPEDGWTLELLNEVTYINGKDIDLPFCLNDLGDGFKFSDIEYYDNNSRASAWIQHEGENCLLVASYNFDGMLDEYDDLFSVQLFELLNVSNIQSEQMITVNGLKIGDSIETMTRLLGEPDLFGSDNYYYNTEELPRMIWISCPTDSDIITTIIINLNL
jgi:hypothetical protein